MAEGIMKYLMEAHDDLKDKIKVESAGIYACDGNCASENAIAVLRDEWGIDIGEHRSRSVKKEIIDNADLILTMTRGHKQTLLSLFPEAKGRIHTLKEYVMEVQPEKDAEPYNYMLDIADPYGMPVHIYKKCAVEIMDAIDKLISKLKNSDIL